MSACEGTETVVSSIGRGLARTEWAERLAARRQSWYNKDMKAAPRTEQELREQVVSRLRSEDETRRETERLQG